MKNIFVTLLTVMLSISLFGQHAKKPTIMVVPSDQYCISRGYSIEFDNQGTKVTLPDYKKALQNDSDLRLVISKMSGLMADRGFPLKDLEQELKSLEKESAMTSMTTSKDFGMGVAESPVDALLRTAKADIIMDLSFEVKRRGPDNYITYILNGIDAYTSKNVASSSGAGEPSSAATPDVLLEEAVLSHMDEFNGRLMAFFTDMFEKGREVKLLVKVFEGADDLETEYGDDDDELSTIIEDWVADNTVEGRFSLTDATENQMRFEQVRIPLFYERKGKQRAMDTRKWAKGLSKYLKKDPYNIVTKVQMVGLGQAYLYIGSK